MTKKIIYKGEPTDLIDEWEYELYKANGRYYKGLVLRNNGILVYINKENAGIGVTNDMSRIAIRQAIVLGAAREDVVFDPIIVAEAKEKLASKVPSIAGQANWFYGLGAMAVENTPGAFRLRNGLLYGNQWSPKYYKGDFLGGTKARIKAYNFGKIGKTLGGISTGIGVGMDLIGVGVYFFANPNSSFAVNPWYFLRNLGMTIYGSTVAAPAAIGYFGVEAFYPGGFDGFITDGSAAQDEANEMNQRNGGSAWTRPRIIPWGVK